MIKNLLKHDHNHIKKLKKTVTLMILDRCAPPLVKKLVSESCFYKAVFMI